MVDALRVAAQALLDDVKMDLNLSEGEVAMFVLDMPDVPPQYAPVMIAQTNQAQSSAVKPERSMGVCHPVANAPSATPTLENTISPVGETQAYFNLYEKRTVEGPGKVTVLQGPKHGVLRLVTEGDRGRIFSSSSGPVTEATQLYVYLPEAGYIGKDSATVLVEIGGLKVKVVYSFQAIDAKGIGAEFEKIYCGPKGYRWKISLSNPNDPTGQLLTFNSPTQLTSYLAGTVNVDIQIADLAAGAVGQTTGTTITLDTNAAGHGWFIDSTPGSNDEFLPTHNPNEWIAKAGSDAAGKMDMLSVLLHEYGHVLGIGHSTNGNDLMATTLTPGMRRMPTTDELALMAELVAGLKADLQASSVANSVTTNSSDSPLPFPWLPLDSTLGLAFLGRLRNRLGGLAADNAALTPALSQGEREVSQYAVVANATLENGTLDAPQGWLSQGNVAFTNGAAVLNEVSASQTRLSQVFMVGAQDRYLSFTIGGTALDDQLVGPDDAFEAALLDANTGASLAGALNLSRTDALFNLQANGTERLSQGITCADDVQGSTSAAGAGNAGAANNDGGRTY